MPSGGELTIKDDVARTYGNSSVIEIECSKCDTKVELQSLGNTSGSWTAKNALHVNRRMVYAASEMGVGRESMSALCDILNMPSPCNLSAWNNHVNTLYEAHKKVVAENLDRAKEKVTSLHEPNEANVVEIAVSYDGTWSKRAYTANFGVGFVIAADTGEILDYDFDSKICMECAKTMQDLGEDICEFSMWYSGHQDQCTQSHTGSSGSMQCTIAKKIWDRSKESGIHYKFMISDGDSKAYGSISDTYRCCDDCQKYENMDKEYKTWLESKGYKIWREKHDSGDADCSRVFKLDCIGHVQKRMGDSPEETEKKGNQTEGWQVSEG